MEEKNSPHILVSLLSVYVFHLAWRKLNAWMNSFPVFSSRPLKGRWVIDCAVGVTGVSMTQMATEPWANSQSTMRPEYQS